MTNIPLILHQTAPSDLTKWPKVWGECQKSWCSVYPHFKYRMWTDEDIDQFVKSHFPYYYQMWKAYPQHIMRVDLVRYMILYEYGGIYADMDYEVLEDFVGDLPPDKVSVSESPYKENENVQNALMCCPAKHPFWQIVLQIAETRKDHPFVLYATGPQLIDAAIEKAPKHYINILPASQYNPHKSSREFFKKERFKTRHHGTTVWG